MSSLNSSGNQTSKLVLVLLTAVCLAANGAYAADSTTANGAPKPVAPSSASLTHPPATHTVAKKAGTLTTTPHYPATRRATSHSGTAQSAAGKTSSHVYSASAAKTAPHHTTAYVSQRQGAAARNRRVRPLTGPQRLARVHLQPERVQEIQQALIHEGYLQGDASGQWDSRTHDAMLRYQTDHGFSPTGLPDAKSIMKLGLGSHPLPSELDHGTVGAANPAAAPGDLNVTPPSPPVSQAIPPS